MEKEIKRYTRKKDSYPCRIKECKVESWLEYLNYDFKTSNWCDSCPFEELVNQLGEYEDLLEIVERRAEDDF